MKESVPHSALNGILKGARLAARLNTMARDALSGRFLHRRRSHSDDMARVTHHGEQERQASLQRLHRVFDQVEQRI